MKKTNVEITDAGRFVDSSSVATLACAETKLTMAGQMLSATSTEASLYSAFESLSTQNMIPPVASVARIICNSNVRKYIYLAVPRSPMPRNSAMYFRVVSGMPIPPRLLTIDAIHMT